MSSRTVDLRPFYGVRLVFAPWWKRWWLLLTTDGRAHVALGEPCVLYRYHPTPPEGDGR